MSNKVKQRVMGDTEFLEMLRAKKKKTSLKALAKELGDVSFQYLAKVLKGICSPGPTIAKALGYEQATVYRPLPPKPISKKKIRKLVSNSTAPPAHPKKKAKAAK